MKVTLSALRRLRGGLLFVSLLIASSGAILALRLDRVSLGIALLIIASIGLFLTFIAALLQPFVYQGSERRFNPRRRRTPPHR